MMKEPVKHGCFYHVFNRGNNYENVFIDNDDYEHFLELYDILIDTVADTYAWCLLKNHFHVLLRIRNEDEIGYFNSDDAKSTDMYVKWRTHVPEKPDKKHLRKPNPPEQFKHLFSTYATWFNKKHKRMGSLFCKNYSRIRITDEKYYANLILYIHNNPVKHGFTDLAIDYPWSSFLTVVSTKNTKLKREEVIRYFKGIKRFKNMHNKPFFEGDHGLKRFIVE